MSLKTESLCNLQMSINMFRLSYTYSPSRHILNHGLSPSL